MSDYVQCPNCGGYKVSLLDTIKETYKQPEKYRAYGCYSWVAGVIGFMLVIFAFLFVASLIDGAISLIIGESGSLCVPLAIIPSIIVAIPAAIFMGKRDRKSALAREAKGEVVQITKEAIIGYRYSCYICGNRWQWNVGTPLPRVTLRPDLIQKGEQRLEEERRKQEEDAAALYYLTHKK
jgi:hypothetical protein